MKIVSLIISIVSLSSQEIAVTTRGDSVYLYPNQTWDYKENVDFKTENPDSLFENKTEFEKPGNAVKESKGLNNAYSIYFDPNLWRRVPTAELNPDADLAYTMKVGDVYSMVIYEEIEIQFDFLPSIALQNAKTAAPNMVVDFKELRTVNGKKVICMQMSGTTQGIDITYMSYYYSDANGSIQFHTFTGQKLYPKYKSQIEDMLNGLIINSN